MRHRSLREAARGCDLATPSMTRRARRATVPSSWASAVPLRALGECDGRLDAVARAHQPYVDTLADAIAAQHSMDIGDVMQRAATEIEQDVADQKTRLFRGARRRERQYDQAIALVEA